MITVTHEGITVNPDDWDDLEVQVRELETHELLALYDMFAENPTLFQLVSGELTHRADTETQLEASGQVDEIRSRGL